jgi:hypothetical protein
MFLGNNNQLVLALEFLRYIGLKEIPGWHRILESNIYRT